MSPTPVHIAWIILASFLAALVLTILPLPQWAVSWRPEWVALVLIYWCISLPQRVGLGTAWCAGIILDVVNDTLIGQHALGLVLVAYLTLNLHRRIRFFPVWQQALGILLLIALEQLVALIVNGVIGRPVWDLAYWLPSFVSMLLWPGTFVTLRALSRRYISRDE